jgi:hypothetical protein
MQKAAAEVLLPPPGGGTADTAPPDTLINQEAEEQDRKRTAIFGFDLAAPLAGRSERQSAPQCPSHRLLAWADG